MNICINTVGFTSFSPGYSSSRNFRTVSAVVSKTGTCIGSPCKTPPLCFLVYILNQSFPHIFLFPPPVCFLITFRPSLLFCSFKSFISSRLPISPHVFLPFGCWITSTSFQFHSLSQSVSHFLSTSLSLPPLHFIPKFLLSHNFPPINKTSSAFPFHRS